MVSDSVSVNTLARVIDSKCAANKFQTPSSRGLASPCVQGGLGGYDRACSQAFPQVTKAEGKREKEYNIVQLIWLLSSMYLDLSFYYWSQTHLKVREAGK